MHKPVTSLAAAALLLLAAGPPVALAAENPAPTHSPAVVLDYYYEPGCEDCLKVGSEVMPRLIAQYTGFYVLREWDVGRGTNYLRLASALERAGVDANAHVYMVVDGTIILAGFGAIRDRLFAALDERISSWRETPPSPAGGPGMAEAAPDLARRRLERFTLWSVLVGGFVDGLNPCAFSTLVFLISLLSLSRVAGRRLLLVGAAFCLASFLTYVAIGLGLLRTLHLLSCFHDLRRGMELALVAALSAFAFYSFRDGVRFRGSHRPKDVTLRLPQKVKERIHRILRAGLSREAQVAWGFGVGALVTAIESVCTGQVYVPTLALIVKSGAAVGRAMGYLLLYDLMFVAPLVTVFLLTYRGLKLPRLVAWSVKNVFWSKMLLGAFFLALAVVILLAA